MSADENKSVKSGAAAPRALSLRTLTWLLPAALLACSAPVETSPANGNADESAIEGATSGSVRTQIYGGERDNDEQSVGSVVALRIGTGTVFELCTGALIAPNLVLTARHCISKNTASTVICDEYGKTGNGDHVGADLPIDSISVYTGATPKFSEPAKARARELVHHSSGVLCDRDIAFVVLDRALEGIPLAKVRVGYTITPGESIRSIGYGKNDMSLPTGTRIRRENIPVLAVGRAVSKTKTPLALREFEVGLSTCQGDSGGPAISETTGAVVGVVSRGGNCADDFGHIYTATGGHGELFARAFLSAGAVPILEPGDSLTAEEPEVVEPAPKTKPISQACSVDRNASPAGGVPIALALALALTTAKRRARR